MVMIEDDAPTPILFGLPMSEVPKSDTLFHENHSNRPGTPLYGACSPNLDLEFNSSRSTERQLELARNTGNYAKRPDKYMFAQAKVYSDFRIN